MLDLWWCWSQWQWLVRAGSPGHMCRLMLSLRLQSLVSAAVKTYSTISSWIQVHWAAELQFAVPALKVSTKFCDKFHNWQYLEKVPTRAFSLKISIKWVHLTLRNLSSKIFAKWVLVSGLICEDLKTACQVNYRLTHCDKCQFIKVL